MGTNEKTLIENVGIYLRNSVTLKLVTIFILMLILMIPVSFILELIRERETLRQTAEGEVTCKWSGEQILYGPILTIPATKEYHEDGKVSTVRENIHILPNLLKVNGQMSPLLLNRGIYKVVVYNSVVKFSGSFEDIHAYLDSNTYQRLLWDEAFLTIHVSDLRGINERVLMDWNNQVLTVEPGTDIPEIVQSGFTVKGIFSGSPDEQQYQFNFDINLQGSRHLGFVPLGRETNINLISEWKHPAFSGSFLPDKRIVNDEGFEANYKVLELNRNYPQVWEGNRHIQSIRDSTFGVDLLFPVNEYQKVIRSAKYALLIISLTFLTTFLVEVISRKKIHPFQYILIGFALVVFYTLLISITEHASFEIAYAIATTSVLTLIGLYSRVILGNLKQTLVLVAILFLSYAFVYFTLQIQEYALLLGSILITVVLAFTMFITRNINWYDMSSNSSN